MVSGGTTGAVEESKGNEDLEIKMNSEDAVATEKASEEELLDEEGLRLQGYDVILCGTGLTQSILAAALARAGKSILHCDNNDFYGDMDAVLPLGALTEWVSASNKSSGTDSRENVNLQDSIPLHASEISCVRIDSVMHPEHSEMNEVEKGMAVMTPYGRGIVLNYQVHDEIVNITVQLDGWIMADGRSPIAYFKHPKNENESEIIPLHVFLFKKYVQSRQRSFALDLSPTLLHADGEAVDGMINSGVSEYCEFKSIIGLNLFMKTAQKRLGSRTTESVETKAVLSRVPCSKRDVFQTKLLSPMDKRRLMKFLQIASDYATAVASTPLASNPATSQGDESESKNEIEEEIVTSLNERQLQQGRSLYRPQNKTVAKSDVEVLEKCMKEGMPFDKYLSQHHKLSDHMKKVVIHAMAMGSHHADVEEYSTKDGMNDLSKHLQSLGKFGGTAFLFPLYGSGELSQAFCRSAAVHGATYLLRRGPQSIHLDEAGKAVAVEVNGCAYDDNDVVSNKVITATNIVIPSQMLRKESHVKKSALRVYRRVSILKGKLVKDEDANELHGSEQRHVIIIPPGDENMKNKSVINGISLDESVNIAPRQVDDVSTTILYLSTISEDADGGATMLEKAVKSICAGSADSMELFHVSFSFELDDSSSDALLKKEEMGIHLCPSRGSALTAESAFIDAKSIFEKICPGEKFLILSKSMDDLVKESRAGYNEEDDEEVKMLEMP